MTERTHKYDDLLRLPHHVSETRPRMSLLDRAAQFSPFAALTGYEDIIDETARRTNEKRELSEELRRHIGEQLSILQAWGDSAQELSVTFFVPDARKSGGAYRTVRGRVKTIDVTAGVMELRDGTRIPFDDVFSIEPSPEEGK